MRYGIRLFNWSMSVSRNAVVSHIGDIWYIVFDSIFNILLKNTIIDLNK